MADNRLRQRMRVIHLLAFLAVLLGGCLSPGPGSYVPGAPHKGMEALEDALAHGDGAGSEGMIRKLEALVDQYPEFVEAHRHLQNLYLGENRYGYLVRRYGEAVSEEPSSPANNYLYGRLFSDPEKQLRAFSDAVNLDGSFFWGYNGLGYVLRTAGRFTKSEAAFLNALKTAPNRIEAYQGLISLYLAFKKYDQAEKILNRGLKRFPHDLTMHLLRFQYIAGTVGQAAALQALVEIPPEAELQPEFFLYLLKSLDETSSDRMARTVLYRFGTLAEENGEYHGALDFLLGVCCRRLGNLNGALRHLTRVYAISPEDGKVRRELRYLYAVTGRLREALALETEDCMQEWIQGSRYGEASSRILELEPLLKGRDDLGARFDEAFELAELFTKLGWLEEALFYLSPLADVSTEVGNKAAKLMDEIYRHLTFELTLREFFLERYKKYRFDGSSQDLEDTLEELGRISTRILGRNIFENIAFKDYSPAGVLMDIRPTSPPGPADYFRRFHRFFLLGRKMGGPVEAYLLDIFDQRPGRVREFAGSRIEFDLIRCENLRIPSYIEFEGGNITGAGLHSLMFVNLDFLRQEVQKAWKIYDHFRHDEKKLLEDPTPAVSDRDEALDVTEPLGLSERLAFISYKNIGMQHGKAAYLAARFDGLVHHEFQHLLDARRFLPLSEHLGWKLYHLVIRGFSRFNVEAWLEERAQLFTLYFSEDPHAALSEIAEYLRGPTLRSPHQKGYRNLMTRIVEYIFDRPEQFPFIDREANLVHQLHRLSRKDIREIARALVEEEGLNEKL